MPFLLGIDSRSGWTLNSGLKGAENIHHLMKVMDITRENTGGVNSIVVALKDGVFIPLKSFTKYLNIFHSAWLLVVFLLVLNG